MPAPPVLLSASLQHNLESREDWDPNTVLYQPYEVEQIIMPDSAICLAVETFFKMLQLPYTIKYRMNAEYMSPSGKVPFIKSGPFVVSELEHIVEFARNKGHTLTENLDEVQLSDMRAYMSLVNIVLGNAETYVVWFDKEILPNTKLRYSHVYPFPLNIWVTYLRKSSSKNLLRARGWMNKTLEQVYSEVDQCCSALSSRLGESKYFFDRPTELDALVFGHIYIIVTTTLCSKQLAAIVRGYTNLIDHCKRIEELYFNFPRHQLP